MLSSVIRFGRPKVSSKMTPAVCMAIRRLDPLEAKMAQKRAQVDQQATEPEAASDSQSIKYSTTDNFQNTVQEKRIQGADDADHGDVPTNMQKRLLVATRLYPSTDFIPNTFSQFYSGCFKLKTDH
ncbi:unnamed protein product [Caenorhabditis sp. 36 PRJEB53466]|nr:unnamed protein product [Caenorhabditis sp. 36 PRJEB53466]